MPLARCLNNAAVEMRLKVDVIRTMCNLIQSIGYEFAIFIPVMESVSPLPPPLSLTFTVWHPRSMR